MRFIDIEPLATKIPPELFEAAERARAAVLAAPAADRALIIEAHSDVWSAMKPFFAQLSHQKCWYTESKNAGFDKDMDHFRPKNKVHESPDHPGYWWMAFDWRNYRFCCQFPNRLRKNPMGQFTGGKGTYFPLMNPEARVTDPSGDLDGEEPELLDPTVSTDWRLLWFQADGMPTVAPLAAADPRVVRRVETSILRLNLGYPTFVEDRVILYNKINRKIQFAEKNYRKYAINNDLTAKQAFDECVREIYVMLSPEEAYSAAAGAYVRVFRALPWVEIFVV